MINTYEYLILLDNMSSISIAGIPGINVILTLLVLRAKKQNKSLHVFLQSRSQGVCLRKRNTFESCHVATMLLQKRFL